MVFFLEDGVILTESKTYFTFWSLKSFLKFIEKNDIQNQSISHVSSFEPVPVVLEKVDTIRIEL